MYRWISGLVVAAVVLGVGVGCGGSSDDSESNVTKAQFVKQANVICADHAQERVKAANAEYNKKVEEAGETKAGSAKAKAENAELETLLATLLEETIVPSLRDQQEELESLDVPAADEAKIEKMLQNLDKAIDAVEKEGIPGLVANHFDPFEAEVKAYGLKCKIV